MSETPGLPTPPAAGEAAAQERPAPVVTDSGTYGRLPPPPETDYRQFDKRSFNARGTLSWVAMIGFALTAFTAVLVHPGTWPRWRGNSPPVLGG